MLGKYRVSTVPAMIFTTHQQAKLRGFAIAEWRLHGYFNNCHPIALHLAQLGTVAEPDGELAIDGWPSLIGWPLSLC